jgi:hypothetical protein
LSNETITILLSIIAVVIALASLYRTRKFNEIQLELQKIQAGLAEKQLEQLIEDDVRSGQPIFAIRSLICRGMGDQDSPNYTVKVEISVDNTGEEYLEGQSLIIGAWHGGRFLGSPGVSAEHRDLRDHDPILGKHIIILKPDSNLESCKILISYTDNKGSKRIQEFSIFPEGPKGCLPFEVHFELKKILKMVPSTLWKI